jgi:hypothetical protein
VPETAAKAGHAVVFFVLVKTLPLPTLVMWRMGSLAVLLFHLAFIPVGFAAMALNELVLSHLPFASVSSVVAFLMGMLWLQWLVLRSARLPAQ